MSSNLFKPLKTKKWEVALAKFFGEKILVVNSGCLIVMYRLFNKRYVTRCEILDKDITSEGSKYLIAEIDEMVEIHGWDENYSFFHLCNKIKDRLR